MLNKYNLISVNIYYTIVMWDISNKKISVIMGYNMTVWYDNTVVINIGL